MWEPLINQRMVLMPLLHIILVLMKNQPQIKKLECIEFINKLSWTEKTAWICFKAVVDGF